MRSIPLISAFATAVLATVPAFAQSVQILAPVSRPVDDPAFSSIGGLEQQNAGFSPQLRQAQLADSDDWPASLYARFTDQYGRLSACTAALVGPRVVLTAAHCVPPSHRININVRNRGYSAKCSIPERYIDGDDSADWSLCRIENGESVTPPGTAPFFETIDTSNFSEMHGQTLMLSGFGCTSDQVGGGSDRKYRIGTNVIVAVTGRQSSPPDLAFDRPGEKFNLFTDRPGANLCPGDSGGPAFTIGAATTTSAFERRVIRAVNSRVFYTDETKTTYGSSLLSATGSDYFRNWARQWAAPPQGAPAGTPPLGICGVSGSPANCRNN